MFSLSEIFRIVKDLVSLHSAQRRMTQHLKGNIEGILLVFMWRKHMSACQTQTIQGIIVCQFAFRPVPARLIANKVKTKCQKYLQKSSTLGYETGLKVDTVPGFAESCFEQLGPDP